MRSKPKKTSKRCAGRFSHVAAGAKTGMEVEAPTGVGVAALTLYDICKAVDKTIGIAGIHLMKRTKR